MGRFLHRGGRTVDQAGAAIVLIQRSQGRDRTDSILHERRLLPPS